MPDDFNNDFNILTGGADINTGSIFAATNQTQTFSIEPAPVNCSVADSAQHITSDGLMYKTTIQTPIPIWVYFYNIKLKLISSFLVVGLNVYINKNQPDHTINKPIIMDTECLDFIDIEQFVSSSPYVLFGFSEKSDLTNNDFKNEIEQWEKENNG